MPLVFSKDQIRKHLADLGYKDVPEEKLNSFIHDLKKLIKHDEIVRHKRRLGGDGTVYSTDTSSPGPSSSLGSTPATANQTQGTTNGSSAYYSPPPPATTSAPGPSPPVREKDVIDSQKPKPKTSRPIVIVQAPHKPSNSKAEASKQPSQMQQQQLPISRPKSAVAVSRPSISTADVQKRRPLSAKQSSKPVIVKEIKSKESKISKKKGPPSDSSTEDEEFERLYQQLMQAREKSEDSDQEQEQRRPRVPLPPANIRRDPVALYHFYKSYWDKYKVPGEDGHMQIRWNVRAGTIGRIPCDPDGLPTKYLKDGKPPKRDPSCRPCQTRDEYIR